MFESYEIDMIKNVVIDRIKTISHVIKTYDMQKILCITSTGNKIKPINELESDLKVLEVILNKLTMAE